MRHFQRREGVDVDRRCRRAHRAEHVEISVAIIIGVDAALQTHLGRIALDRLGRAAAHFLQVQAIGRSALGLGAALGEGAEAAFVETDVGVVDVAVDDETHRFARHFAAQGIGGIGDQCDIRPIRLEQPHDIGGGKTVARRCAAQDSAQTV